MGYYSASFDLIVSSKLWEANEAGFLEMDFFFELKLKKKNLSKMPESGGSVDEKKRYRTSTLWQHNKLARCFARNQIKLCGAI